MMTKKLLFIFYISEQLKATAENDAMRCYESWTGQHRAETKLHQAEGALESLSFDVLL